MASKKPSAVGLELRKPQQTFIERAGHRGSTQFHLIRPWRCPVWNSMLPRRSRFSPCHDHVEPGNHSGAGAVFSHRGCHSLPILKRRRGPNEKKKPIQSNGI
ncbi:hypothetical protein ASPFODRAFT_44558, partial [Aspergillus luchuensis CBS 106.47]